MHVRLICAIKFYLLTYLLTCLAIVIRSETHAQQTAVCTGLLKLMLVRTVR